MMIKKALGLLAIVGVGFLAYQTYKEMAKQSKPKLKKDLD